jgi:hypothetical protein
VSLPLDILTLVAYPQSPIPSKCPRLRLRPNASFRLLPVFSLLLLAGLGCSRQAPTSGSSLPATASSAAPVQSRKISQSKEDAARQELEQIPPPSKNQYLRVRTKDAYQNPFLVVHSETVTLTIIFPDQNPNAFGTGGMLRPANARKEQLEVRLADLPNALASLPPGVWPYGRVVAIEESPAARRMDRVAIRRSVEAAMRTLNALGVVADEWTSPNGALLR